MNTSRKKIGLIIYANPDHYPPTVNAIYLLAEYFDIVLIGRNQDLPDRVYPPNVEIHRLGAFSTLQERLQASSWQKLQEFVQFVVEARRILQDVSLIYAYDAFAYVAAYLCCKFFHRSLPLIYHNHEITEQTASLSSLTGWVERAERSWVSQAALIVFPDEDRSAFYQQRALLTQPLMIVPNFPLKSLFRIPKDWATGIEQRWNTRTLFYRGTISETSSMKEVVSSAARLDDQTSVKFVGFLNSDAQTQLEAWVSAENMTRRFSYLGRLPYAELTSHTLSATVGSALYKSVSYDRVACATACNKIYEYAACGLPVIVSDFPTYRNYLANESWVHFADPNSPSSIQSAIQAILSNFEDYQQQCLAARQAFEQRFNYESVFYPLLLKIKELVA